MRDYAAIALQYAESVIAGSQVACRYVKLACQRHLDDIEKSEAPEYPYRFDREKAARACRFIELMPHTKGRWASSKQKLVLEPWQVFIEASIFGWVKKSDGYRRFTKAYEEVARKNGKSVRLAAVGNYCAWADGETGAEVYSGATTEKQAFEIYRPAWQMVKRTPDLREAFGIECGGSDRNPGPMYAVESGSSYQPIIGKPGDGASPSCALVDEYHEHKTDDLVDTMTTGMGARDQGLLRIITTAGSNLAGPAYQTRQDVIRMLEGSVPAERVFGIIFTIDEGDDWTSDVALQKANPNMGVSVSVEFLHGKIEEGVRHARKQNVVKTKHCNVWVNARTAWMNMEEWTKCADPTLKEEDFAGEPCWIGLDLSSKIDITAAVKWFEREGTWYVFPKLFIPEGQVEENQAYQGWAHEGYLIQTDGNMIDMDLIESDILKDQERFRIVQLGYDNWGANAIAPSLVKAGVECVEVAMVPKQLSDPMKWVEALVKDRRIRHPNNPCFNWMMSNVTARVDANDNIFPRKEQPHSKIDGPVAMIIGRAVAMIDEDDPSVYEERGFIEL